jgi:starvation-inducible DNA-binding protein
MCARAIKSHTPPALATPTDLDTRDVDAVTEAVNALVADALALYIKTKNFHWHVSGPHFRSLHLLFDEHAADILESVDVLAERVRKIGGTTIRSIGHIGSLTSISDDDDDFVSATQMVERLIDDNRQMAERQRAAIELCDEHGDSPTGNILQDLLDHTERRIWFLFELTQGAEPQSAEH